MFRVLVAIATFFMLEVAAAVDLKAATFGSRYSAHGLCGPFPKVSVATPKWLCMGIAAGPAHGLVMPRAIVQFAPSQFIIADMGSWTPGRGRVLRMGLDDNNARITTLFDRLDLPHGLALSPDNLVYVGERGRIWRFDPKLVHPRQDLVLEGLPSKGLHRLKHIVFDRHGALIINVGAPTDRCEQKGRAVAWPCPDEDLDLGALWRLEFNGAAPARPQILARGLRNSVAIAVHPISGLILQGENSADFPGENFPPDELNVIEPGNHYGWPYCVGQGLTIPDYQRFAVDCSRYTSPAALLPAHSAPLGMVYYSGPMFPELHGKLLIAYHGYRANGHRIVSGAVDGQGRPVAGPKGGYFAASDLVGGWSASHTLPLGAPLGLTQAADGSLWFVEDKNRTVMVLLRSKTDNPPPPADPQPSVQTPPPVNGWSDLHQKVLRPLCGQCHSELQLASSELAWRKVDARGWLKHDDLKASLLFRSVLDGEGARPMPPLPKIIDPEDTLRIRKFLSDLAASRSGASR